MVTFIDEWRRKFPSCMVVKRLTSALHACTTNSYFALQPLSCYRRDIAVSGLRLIYRTLEAQVHWNIGIIATSLRPTLARLFRCLVWKYRKVIKKTKTKTGSGYFWTLWTVVSTRNAHQILIFRKATWLSHSSSSAVRLLCDDLLKRASETWNMIFWAMIIMIIFLVTRFWNMVI